MILYLHGSDTYRLRQKVRFYREGFKKKYDPQGYNITVLDGPAVTLEDIRKAAGQVGLLASKRFVVIENIFKTKKKTLLNDVAAYLTDEWSDDNVLIFIDEVDEPARGRKKAARKDTLTKLLADTAKDESFEPLSGTQLLKWISSEVTSRGGKIERAAVGELAALVGSDLWNMASEIEKLVQLKDGALITVDDVRSQVRAQFDENIFHLTDAVAARDGKLTMKLLSDQLASGSNPLYILTMLIRQFRIMLQVKSIAEHEPHPQTIATRLKLHPYVAQKSLRDAKRFTPEELAAIYEQLVEADVTLKSTNQNPRLVFDLLVTRICLPARVPAGK